MSRNGGMTGPVTAYVVVGCAAAMACGRVAFDARSDARSGDAIEPGDALDAADAFVVASGPFGPPTVIAALSSASPEQEACFTGDRLEMYFRRGPPASDLYVSRRMTTAEPWGAPQAVIELNDPIAEDITPGISRDGLAIWFASNRSGGSGMLDIWMSTRPTRNAPWGTPVPVPTLNSPSNDVLPWPSADLQRMYFSSDRMAGVNDPYIAIAASATTWQTPQRSTDIDSAANDGGPRLFAGELQIVFDSDRTGNSEIWTASRASTSEPFSPATRLDELNTPMIDWDPWISEDGSYIVFGSDRSGNQEIYEASR